MVYFSSDLATYMYYLVLLRQQKRTFVYQDKGVFFIYKLKYFLHEPPRIFPMHENDDILIFSKKHGVNRYKIIHKFLLQISGTGISSDFTVPLFFIQYIFI